jgi:DNA-binding PadR family transcriptional regulator
MVDPVHFLPLTPFAFHVLLALADGERHGYGIIKEVEDRSGGTVTLRTGTLYTLLARLKKEGLIAEAGLPEGAEPGDDRRRYYELTPLGDEVLKAEARRLEALVIDARRKHVLGVSSGA